MICYSYSVTIEHGRASLISYDSGCFKVTGYRSEEFLADPILWYRIIHPEDRETVIEQADAVLSGKTAAPLNYRVIHKDGRIHRVRNAVVLRYDVNGKLASYEGLISMLPDQNLKGNTLLNVERRVDKSTKN